VMTFMAIWLGTAVSGSVVTEVVFDWPGVGNLFLSAIIARDFPIIQAVVGLIAVAVLTANLLVDLLYGLVDPRISVTKSPVRWAPARR
jgi:peptide/nickel transport system permease protein